MENFTEYFIVRLQNEILILYKLFFIYKYYLYQSLIYYLIEGLILYPKIANFILSPSSIKLNFDSILVEL